jgi:hypothetical protein
VQPVFVQRAPHSGKPSSRSAPHGRPRGPGSDAGPVAGRAVRLDQPSLSAACADLPVRPRRTPRPSRCRGRRGRRRPRPRRAKPEPGERDRLPASTFRAEGVLLDQVPPPLHLQASSGRGKPVETRSGPSFHRLAWVTPQQSLSWS